MTVIPVVVIMMFRLCRAEFIEACKCKGISGKVPNCDHTRVITTSDFQKKNQPFSYFYLNINAMESIVINTNSKSHIKLLQELAKELGISFHVLTKEEKEDMGLLLAMEEGKKTSFVSRDKVVKYLRKNAK